MILFQVKKKKKQNFYKFELQISILKQRYNNSSYNSQKH